MKKICVALSAFLLTTALLLSGCEQSNTPSGSYRSSKNSTFSSYDSFSFSYSHTSLGGFDLDKVSSALDSKYEGLRKEYDSYVDDLFAGLEEIRGSDDAPVEFTDEDLELQGILKGLDRGLSAVDIWLTTDGPALPNGKTYVSSEYFIMNKGMDQKLTYRPIPDNYRIEGLPVPTTCKAMRELVMEYFTEAFADNFMGNYAAKGSLTENPDGTYSIVFDENGGWFADFMELDGQLYWQGNHTGGKGLSALGVLCRSAKVISKTEDTIEFSYLDDFNIYDEEVTKLTQSCLNDVSRYEENAKIGVLKYERNGWRRDFNKEMMN